MHTSHTTMDLNTQFRSIRSLSGRTFFYVQFRLRQHECFIIICWRDSWLVTGVSLLSYPRSVLNQVSLRSIFSGAKLYDLCCTRSVQFGGIVPSLMNGTVKNSSSNITQNWCETWKVAGFRTRSTDPAWNGEWPILIPINEQSYHLGSPATFPCNLSSKTWTGKTHVWWF